MGVRQGLRRDSSWDHFELGKETVIGIPAFPTLKSELLSHEELDMLISLKKAPRDRRNYNYGWAMLQKSIPQGIGLLSENIIEYLESLGCALSEPQNHERLRVEPFS